MIFMPFLTNLQKPIPFESENSPNVPHHLPASRGYRLGWLANS